MNIYSHMSTNPENLVKIVLVGSESLLLQAIVKKEDEDDEKESSIQPAFSLAG